MRKFKDIKIINERKFFELYVSGDLAMRKLTPELSRQGVKQTGYTATVSKMPNAVYKEAMQHMITWLQNATNDFNDGESCTNVAPKRTFTQNEVTEMALKQYVCIVKKLCIMMTWWEHI